MLKVKAGITLKKRNILSKKSPDRGQLQAFNFLVNPLHDRGFEVKIAASPVPFPFDTRLFKTDPSRT
jgi:hypothetical protein